jgi:hypothetical protein
MSHEADYDPAANAATVRVTRRRLMPQPVKRASTPAEVKTAFQKLGYNPMTVTVNGLCTDLYTNFYRNRTDIPLDQRNPNRDCTMCPVFGQACDLLGLITDQELQEHYLWLHSGAMIAVKSQTVCLSDFVSFIQERDKKSAEQATWATQLPSESTGSADACVVIEDDYVFVDHVDALVNAREGKHYNWSYVMSSVTQNLLALFGANTVEC